MKAARVRAAGMLLVLVLMTACRPSVPRDEKATAVAQLPPTYTPQPTYTPMPTYTPVPTYTPMPTYTPPATPTMERPSPTPSPTSSPTPTRTPTATWTPTPTGTPSPSPAPTRTSTPTSTRTPARAPTETPANTVVLSPLEQANVDAINQERKARNLTPLAVDPVLMELARGHAQDMIDRSYFSHTTPEGKTFKMRLKEKGIVLNWTGENFYATTSPESEVVAVTMQWLMGDPTHRRNILNVNYRQVGVGVVKNASGLYMTVQDFTE